MNLADEVRRQYEGSERAGLFPLSIAAIKLGYMGLKIKAVTLRKYCIAGRYGLKAGRDWLLSSEELAALAALPPETRKAGRPRKARIS
jgi:hypothetical protein